MKEELRKRNLTFYNALVVAKEEKEKLSQTLLKFGLREETIHSFLLQNKFLDKNKKEGLLTTFWKLF